jgi:hypothetical protein
VDRLRVDSGISFSAMVMLDKLRSMRVDVKPSRAWLVPACLLTALVFGAICLRRAAQQPRGSRTPESSGPEVPALATNAALPPSTPAFSPPGPDLVGRVVSMQGDPVPGAKILIDAAGPRVGRGYT